MERGLWLFAGFVNEPKRLRKEEIIFILFYFFKKAPQNATNADSFVSRL